MGHLPRGESSWWRIAGLGVNRGGGGAICPVGSCPDTLKFLYADLMWENKTDIYVYIHSTCHNFPPC